MDVDEETGSPRLVHGTRKMATMEQLTQLDSIMEFESRLGRGRRDESVFKLLMQRESGAHSGASDYHPGARVPSSSGSGDMTSLSADQPNTSEGAASPTAARQHQDFCCSPFASIAKSHIGSRYLPRRGRVLAEYADNVFCGQFSESGELFMSASQDNRIRIYDAGTWQLKKTIVAQDVGWSVLSVDYSPDQQWVIYSSWSDYVHMANTSGEHEVHEALHMKPDVRIAPINMSVDTNVGFSCSTRETVSVSSASFFHPTVKKFWVEARIYASTFTT
jgi:WD40 repeat protein